MASFHVCETTSNPIQLYHNSLDASDDEEDDSGAIEAEAKDFLRMRRASADTIFLIRVYRGGQEANYSAAFETAVVNTQLKEKNVIVEYLDADKIRETHQDWTHSRHLIDWLLKSDMHVILAQNIYLGFVTLWNITETLLETRRLEHHYGYPTGK